MALVLADRVQETTTTSGTGTLTLAGAVAGYRTFSTGIGNGNTTYYCIYDSLAQAWEIGLGTVGSGTLARTTVYSNSLGNTSQITLAGNSASVFAVYTASKTVNLDASGNVTPLGTISSGTWNGTTVGVAYGGTGVTASSGANSVVLRDANQNITANNLFLGFTSTVTAAGTTTLTVASTQYQRFTGTTTQTIKLPDATTLQKGYVYTVDNDSTGNLSVIDSASGALDTIVPGTVDDIILLDNSTVAGTWVAYGRLPANYDFGTSSANFGGAVISNTVWNGTAVAPGYGGTGLTTFTAANNALYSTSSSALAAGTLPTAAGGTGLTSFTSGGAVYATSTSALTTGTLPIASGGTNTTSSPTNGGVTYGTGTAYAFTSAGTSGQVLTSNGASAPTWTTISSGVSQAKTTALSMILGF